MNEVPPKQSVTGTDSVVFDQPNGGRGIPGAPRADVQPDGHDPFASGAGLVSLRNSSNGAGADSFPVLKAFRDYLEAERERSRRRLTSLSLAFAAVIIVMVGVFLLIWSSMYGNMQKTQTLLLQAAFANNQAPATQQPAVAAQQPTQTDIAAAIAEAVAKNSGEQSAQFTKALESLSASLEQLRAENEELRKRTEKAAKPPRVGAVRPASVAPVKPAAAAPVAQAAAKPAEEQPAQPVVTPVDSSAVTPAEMNGGAAPSATSADPPVEATTKDEAVADAGSDVSFDIPTFKAPSAPAGFSRASVDVKPKNAKEPVKWQIYMPAK